uniref:Uncharacterized protein n=1 Tax=Steinernema glaseri TaxID=37863 RepID=A0A1I7Y097_9BILA
MDSSEVSYNRSRDYEQVLNKQDEASTKGRHSPPQPSSSKMKLYLQILLLAFLTIFVAEAKTTTRGPYSRPSKTINGHRANYLGQPRPPRTCVCKHPKGCPC